jgi:hypothetical protein
LVPREVAGTAEAALVLRRPLSFACEAEGAAGTGLELLLMPREVDGTAEAVLVLLTLASLP